jgi:hypothetical protein
VNLTGAGRTDLPPSALPGYREALLSGALPRVPSLPPTGLPGRSAQALVRRLIFIFLAGILVLLVVAQVLMRVKLPTYLILTILCLASLVSLWYCQRRMAAVGERLLTELSCGYTTIVMAFGGFWLGRGRRGWTIGWRIPWDFSTVWVLSSDGRTVIRPPQIPGDPPGLYPSDSRVHSLELWTGTTWAGYFATQRHPSTRREGILR